MADLDDFFAKKDKKKPKGKKFTTTVEIAKKLEEKKVEKPRKEKLGFQSSGTGENDNSKIQVDEEEWKEFEEEKKDYSGLKIQNLTLQDENVTENQEAEEEGEMEENEQGELVRKKKGPWKAIEVEAPVAAAPAPAPAKPESNGRPNLYVSPHLRQQSQLQRERALRGKQTVAPDITNTEFFPTLSAASNETPASWGRRMHEGAFEEVRNSRSHSNRDTRVTQSLQIVNKFGALQSENS